MTDNTTTAAVRSDQSLFTKIKERPYIAALILVGFAVPQMTSDVFLIGLALEVFIFAIAVISYDLLFGYSGLLSFGHALFFGGSAYSVAILATNFAELNYFSAIPVSLLLVVLVSIVVGAVSLKLAGVYFAIITLAFGQLAYEMSLEFSSITGGVNGIATLTIPSVFGVSLADPFVTYYIALIVLLFVLAILFRVVNSPFGRTIQGIRENEDRMEMLGVNTYRYKLIAFVLSSFVAAIAGVLYPLYLSFIDPSLLNWTLTGDIVLMTLFGGFGTLWGPILGAAFYILSREYLSIYFEQWRIIFGAIFVAFVLFAPTGFAGLISRGSDAIRTSILSNKKKEEEEEL